jgi:membrane protein insertase Oxa1/YidC/SpoIIIJ
MNTTIALAGICKRRHLRRSFSYSGEFLLRSLSNFEDREARQKAPNTISRRLFHSRLSVPMSTLQFTSSYNRSCSLHAVQTRNISFAESWEWLNELPIWHGGPELIKFIHHDGLIPYWACFAIISIAVRVALFPLVIRGAKQAAEFSKVVPEVQFLYAIVIKDFGYLKQQGKPLQQRVLFLMEHIETLKVLFQKYDIHVMRIFHSPLVQMPIFWYFSISLRKTTNGLDLDLAQNLVDANAFWLSDLTAPDAWYGLPVLAGIMMYANVEYATRVRNLSGEAMKKVEFSFTMKDMFQSGAIFMPCFLCASPAGMQIYVATSFSWTIVQSFVIRNTSFRALVGLPSLDAPPQEPKYAMRFIRLQQLEQEAAKIRGDGPILGWHSVLAPFCTASFPGNYRTSTISISDSKSIEPITIDLSDAEKDAMATNKIRKQQLLNKLPKEITDMQYVHGITAPLDVIVERYRTLMEEQEKRDSKAQLADLQATEDMMNETNKSRFVAQFDDDVIDKANQGIKPVVEKPPEFIGAFVPKSTSKPSLLQLQKKRTVSKKRKR